MYSYVQSSPSWLTQVCKQLPIKHDSKKQLIGVKECMCTSTPREEKCSPHWMGMKWGLVGMEGISESRGVEAILANSKATVILNCTRPARVLGFLHPSLKLLVMISVNGTPQAEQVRTPLLQKQKSALLNFINPIILLLKTNLSTHLSLSLLRLIIRLPASPIGLFLTTLHTASRPASRSENQTM